MTNKLVIKSNDLISANYNLNLNEQKMALYAISKLARNSEQFNLIDINISEFIEILNITDRNYDQIRNIARKLRKKEIIIDTEKSEYITGWFSSVNFNKNDGNIKIRFDDDLVPYLLKLKQRFTRYELKNILSMKSAYSIRLYELLKQYEKIGKREIKLVNFKNCLGLEQDTYSRFYDLEKRVLQVAKKEINKVTDLIIDYEKVRTGKKITSILFTIESKDQAKKVYIDFLDKNYNIEEIKSKSGLEKEHFNSEQIINLLTAAVEKFPEGEEDELFKYIKLNYLYMIRGKKADNPYSYLMKLLQEDYVGARAQIKLNYEL